MMSSDTSNTLSFSHDCLFSVDVFWLLAQGRETLNQNLIRLVNLQLSKAMVP